MAEIAIIGDIHRQITPFDVDYFNSSFYDLLLFTGDLPYHGSTKEKQLASLLATLEKPALYMPGNHDCVSMAQFIAEAKGNTWLASATGAGQQRLVEELRHALGPVIMCGYSSHEYRIGNIDFCVIAGRPLSFGGPELHYERYLEANFGVTSLEESAAHLRRLIDDTETRQLLFLSHNGPSGLGEASDSIWGCDFKPGAGDCGDPDLEDAVNYAKIIGKQVTAVIAGHMHHALQHGGSRQSIVERNNTFYINAARVPRIFSSGAQTIYHHVHLQLDQKQAAVQEKLIAAH